MPEKWLLNVAFIHLKIYNLKSDGFEIVFKTFNTENRFKDYSL